LKWSRDCQDKDERHNMLRFKVMA